MLYWEDLQAGATYELGSHVVGAEEIVEFARRFDPQPFHLDEEAARQSLFGGLVASGWHSAAIGHRLLVDGFVGQVASMGSPGVEELKWLVPVRAGDTVSLRVTLEELRPSSKPDRGYVRTRQELRNQRGELVMTMVGRGIVARRARAGG